MKFTASKKRSLTAFAMMEVIVAAAITGVAFVSLYAGLSTGFGLVRLARENLRGTQILQEKMETLRLYTWDQINTPNFVPITFTEDFIGSTGAMTGLVYTGAVQIATAPVSEVYAADLKQITIQVRWRSGRTLRTREMTSFIAKNGLQDYIY